VYAQVSIYICGDNHRKVTRSPAGFTSLLILKDRNLSQGNLFWVPLYDQINSVIGSRDVERGNGPSRQGWE